MSINRDMKPVLLQVKQVARTSSGAEKVTWNDVEIINAAIYKNSDLITTASARYKDSSHTGLTYCKSIKEGVNQLKDGDTIYQITGCNTKPRLTNLILKEVDTDV